MNSDLQEDPDAVRDAFYGFLMGVVESWSERQQQEEGSVIRGDNTEY